MASPSSSSNSNFIPMASIPPVHGPNPAPSPPANFRWKAPFVVGKSLDAVHPVTYRFPDESSAPASVRSSPVPPRYVEKMTPAPSGPMAAGRCRLRQLPASAIAGHPHTRHWEEVWCKLPPDSSFLFLGSEVRKEEANEAFLVPPNGETVHSVVNLSPRPMSWFYFSHYTIKVDYPGWVYEVPSIPPQKIQK